MHVTGKWMVALAILAVGCGDDDKDDETSCDAATCDDAAVGGDGDTGGDGDSPGDGDGDTAGDGDGDGDTAGDGDAVIDAGPTGDGDGDGGGEPLAPTDGSQGAYCEGADDCDATLACYDFTRICTATCNDDGDCAAAGDDYSCYVPMGGDGLCRIDCANTDCPDGQECIPVGGGGGGGGGLLRCGWSPGADQPPATAGDATFDACQDDGDCGGVCEDNYCTVGCGDDADCAGVAAGDGTAYCLGGGGGGGGGATCTVLCDEGDACPGDTECEVVAQNGGQELWGCVIP